MIDSELNRSIAALLPRTSYELMVSEAQRDALFRLRYTSYLKEEAILPNAEGKLCDRFDDLPNAFNIGVRVDGRLIGAMRVCIWSRQFGFETTPGLEVFREELAPYLHENAVLDDPNRFVIDSDFTQNQSAFAFLVMRINFMACIKFQVAAAIATARREHCGFYIRSFGHKRLTEPRWYPGLLKPLALLINDWPVNHHPTMTKYPSFVPQGDDLEQLFDAITNKSACLEGEQR